MLLVIAALNTCSKTLDGAKKNYKTTDDEDIKELLLIIKNINNNKPESFYSKFSVEGHSGRQNFKASGDVRLNADPRKMKVIFRDAVFRTPLYEVVQDRDIIKFYNPIEKQLFIDNVSRVDLKYYFNYNLNFTFLYNILTHEIPLIKNYSIKKGLESEDGKSGTCKLIILENDFFYETLSFENNIPDKILWVNKKTKDKVEVYLNKPFYTKGILSYKNIRIVTPDADMKINIQFSSKRVNIPVDLKKITYIKLPGDVKIYKKN